MSIENGDGRGSADKLMNAIRVALDNQVGDKNRRQQAEEYLNQLRDSPTGWQRCVDVFMKTKEPKVLFWCLHVFETVIKKRYVYRVFFVCKFFSKDSIKKTINVAPFFFFSFLTHNKKKNKKKHNLNQKHGTQRWNELTNNDKKCIASLLLGFIREVCSVENVPECMFYKNV
ncbi:hypothetical protein RFI_19704 [Reticulomyxa filosa]|uniref:Exportin-T n=1 Tax=Reticulomyxa filosa TaxID=46433 RepID=X6MUF4_RETFI|nr:hypothetical protein RFI_19704 [Reticulomyxa filosa]|eukprot:ETO17618.1 hypothetical protein RFI_19704 [Reticulomyxa filosa]